MSEIEMEMINKEIKMWKNRLFESIECQDELRAELAKEKERVKVLRGAIKASTQECQCTFDNACASCEIVFKALSQTEDKPE